MSVARVKTSRFAARKGKGLRCQRCGRDIQKGEVYRWWFVGFRSRFKHVRCTTCPAPRASELEGSQKADAYAAIEAAEDALAGMEEPGDASDVDQVVSEAAEGVREVADRYREADEAFGGQGSTTAGQMAEELEGAADSLEGFEAEEFDEDEVQWCEDHGGDTQAAIEARETCMACTEALAEAKQTWWDEQVDAARDALGEAGF